MDDIGVRGFRRLAGLVLAALATVAMAVALVLAGFNLTFQLTTSEAVGEVVAVSTVPEQAGVIAPTHEVVVEYPDRNGQSRRFDELVRGVAPTKGDEVPVRYRMGPPVEARVANYWWIWRPATTAGAVALALALGAEELLRNRRRPALLDRSS